MLRAGSQGPAGLASTGGASSSSPPRSLSPRAAPGALSTAVVSLGKAGSRKGKTWVPQHSWGPSPPHLGLNELSGQELSAPAGRVQQQESQGPVPSGGGQEVRPGCGLAGERWREGPRRGASQTPQHLSSHATPQHAAGPAWVRAAPGTRREPPCAAAWATPRAGGRAWLSQQPLLRPQASPGPLQPQFPHLHLGPLSKARPLPTAVRVQGQIGPHALPCATLATAVPSLFRKLPLDLCDLQV